MASKTAYVRIAGSERKPVPGARAIGPAPAQQRMEVQVRVRPRKGLAPLAVMDTQLPKQRRYLTRNEFEAVHGADPKDLRKVGAFAKQHGLVVVESSASRRTVVLAGTVGTFSKAFKVKLEHYQHSRGTYRGRKGPVHVPSGLAEVV